MTEWTDAEISRRLALAIGWRDNKRTKDGTPDPDVVLFFEYHGRESWCGVWFNEGWRKFDYRDPAVIWPIAERFDCFPYRVSGSLRWYAKATFANIGEYADTAAKAVALAVIKSKEQE